MANQDRNADTIAPVRPRAADMVTRPHQLIALVFGVGLVRYGPGTFGTIAGFGLFAALGNLSPEIRAGAYAVLLVAGTWAVRRTGDDLGAGDHNAIVFDETIAMSLALEFVAASAFAWSFAFLLFRLFDIWKPWPIYLVDRTGAGGFPVILDDLLAAVYAVAGVWCAAFLFGLPG